MPSMHFGYALWVCAALAGLLQGGPFQPRSWVGWRCVLAAVALYPASVLFCIIVSTLHPDTLITGAEGMIYRPSCSELGHLIQMPHLCHRVGPRHRCSGSVSATAGRDCCCTHVYHLCHGVGRWHDRSAAARVSALP